MSETVVLILGEAELRALLKRERKIKTRKPSLLFRPWLRQTAIGAAIDGCGSYPTISKSSNW